MPELSEPICHWIIVDESVQNYRLKYRQYRLGYASGAKGEVAHVLQRKSTNTPLGMSNDAEDLFNIVTQWRLDYQTYRRGAARGAKGQTSEIVKGLPKDAFALLPIVQMLKFKRLKKSFRSGFSRIDSSLHVHFGAGRLGLGLVLPSIVAGSGLFVLIQSPSGPWDSCKSGSLVKVKVNGESICDLYVHRDDGHSVDLESKMRMLKVRGAILLVERHRRERSELRKKVIRKATSMSCSVGPGIPSLTEDLLKLNEEEPLKDVSLVACENDHGAVDKMAEALARDTKIEVIPCMVDRICSSFERNAESDITVTTEGFPGEIVLLRPTSKQIGLGGPLLIQPALDAQAKYFAKRKLLLVNGGHTVLAFLTMLRQKESFTPPGNFPLLTWQTCLPQERLVLWSFCIARLLLLAWENDLETLKNAHGVDDEMQLSKKMLDYVKLTLLRFNVPDTTKRILSGGVETRFYGRLKNIQEFLDDASPMSLPLGRAILKLAGIRFCALASEVHNLVSSASKFVSPDSNDFNVPDL